MHRIFQFSRQNGDGEFLVISEGSHEEVLAEHCPDGFDLDHVYELADDGTSLPCDRRLIAS